MNPGCIVRCRNRDWVLLPSDDDEVRLLRPLTGALDEVVAIHNGLSNLVGYDLPAERIQPATFPLPASDDLADAASSHLLWQAARLTLREGASPFRSLGRVSFRPRVYQFVPLLMALRLDPVRMLIADDVGVGKTIEALLIARELWDRGEIRRVCVLCPPYLCDQWAKELAQKFHLEPAIIRSGTVGQLERQKPVTKTIYQHYPMQVASIDYLKSDRNRHQFLLHCPEFIVVDEAHGAAPANNQGQQQRHELVRSIAGDPARHLVLLTATPHSGIEEAFRTLLALLRPDFGEWDIARLDERPRIELARHFVQRTRKDIEQDWDGEHCFPERDPMDLSYDLSPAYAALFRQTYDFCREIVRTGEKLEERKRRVRYWGALALLRCVMSSPAAAFAALETRHEKLSEGTDEMDFRSFVFESTQEGTDDEQPVPPVESAQNTLEDSERRKLRDLARTASRLSVDHEDTKLAGCVKLAGDLLGQGFAPIVWCRYVATAEYVADGLRKAFHRSHPDTRIVCITGRKGDDERRAMIEEIDATFPRVLVATDCLSEGINLQDKFNAVIHYDLPWNPNRLEQREGRVDRYGQTARIVKTVRYFGRDNPVDGVVLDVLLNKAREIHRALGTHVPVPDETETVTQAVLNALFLRGRDTGADQLELDLDLPDVRTLHRRWDQNAERERVNRTRFAQRALRPEEVQRELEATDAVLGDPSAVREFVLAAGQRLGLQIERDRKRKDVYRVAVSDAATASLPEPIVFALPQQNKATWLVSFVSPTPQGAEYLGRNHRFVAAMARYLMEEALTRHGAAHATRCGVMRTGAVSRLSTVLLLRVRYLMEQPGSASQLAEEVRVVAHCNTRDGTPEWLDDARALVLLTEAKPDANIPMAEKKELTEAVLKEWPELERALKARIDLRARELEESYKRVRRAVSLRVRELAVKPELPPDLLGTLVLQPLASKMQ